MLKFKYFDPKTHVAYEERPDGTYCSFSVHFKNGDISVALISDNATLPDLNELVEINGTVHECLKYFQLVN